MTDNPEQKPKTLKKQSAKKTEEKTETKSVVAPAATSPAWSVVALFFLIGAGLVFAVFFGFSRTDLLSGSRENDAQLRAMADRVAQVEGQKSRLDALENSVNRFDATRNALSNLQEKEESDVHRLEAALRELKPETAAKVNLAPVEARLDKLERKVDSISQVEFAEKERLLALALGGLALKNALDAGAPFTAEFAVVRNLLHAGSNLSELGEHADTGVPANAALLARFPQVAQAVLNIEASDDVNFWDRTQNFFRSLVSVRKVGNVPGEDVEAVLARVEFHLQQNDSVTAMKEFQALPDSARQAVGGWGEDLAARAEADGVLRELLLAAAQGLQAKSKAE